MSSHRKYSADLQEIHDKIEKAIKYRLVSVERNSREDLPWTVHIESKLHVRTYCTIGNTKWEVEQKAEAAVARLNKSQRWMTKSEPWTALTLG